MENFREKRLERQLKSQQSTTIVIAVLLLLSILGNVFLFVRSSSVNNEKEELTRERDQLVTENQVAEESNAQLQADIQKLNEQVNAIRESAAALEAEILTRDRRIAQFRRQVAEIEELRMRVAELEKLEEEFKKLEVERQGLMADLHKLSEQLSALEKQHRELESKVEQATYLKAYNICVHNHRDRLLGRPVTMEKATRVNRTTVSFEINGNIFVENGSKNLHLVMIDSDGNVIKPSAETFTVAETGASSRYTEYTSIQYNQRSVPLNFTLRHDEKLDPGTYSMEVYIDGVKAGAKEFNLE